MGVSDAGDKIPGLDSAVGGEVMRYADKAMYEAAPMVSITPKVYLLWMTPDPLGAIAAMSRMYEGKPTYSLSDITDDERGKYWKAMSETHLNAPLESVKLHFFIEGVDRAFTHQMVRQRTAVYAQESLRFAVKENLAQETPYPISFYDDRVYGNRSGQNDLRDLWDKTVSDIEAAYKKLIANGVPAEDARGLLPHAITTRLNYVTDLRNLLEHAGNRLCTQAQFHWRTVFMQIRESIRTYLPSISDGEMWVDQDDNWQFELIANTAFVPQCYLQGRCPFKADFDRGCTIRGRVDQFERRGVPSKEWEDSTTMDLYGIYPIDRSEWANDPQAAWER